MINGLRRQAIPKNVFLIMAIYIQRKDIPRIDKDYRPPVGANLDTMVTVFYQLVRGANGKTRLDSIMQEDSSFDPVRKKDVIKFFSIIALREEFSAEHHMLLTWGHGAAYGLFYDPGPNFNDMLTIDDLAGAITATFGAKGQKIDVVVMMDCYMQFFDTGYTLHQAGVDFLAASVSGADFLGYNYKKLFGTLFSNPDISPRDLACLAVSSIKDNNLANAALKNELNLATFYTVDLGQYEMLAGYMSELGVTLLAGLPGNVQKIRTARNSCQQIHNFYNLIDFFRFVQGLRSVFGANWQIELIDKILGMPSQFIVASYIGRGLKRGKNQVYPLGYSICIPLQQAPSISFFENFFEPGSPHATPFTRKYKWSAFLQQFYLDCPRTGSARKPPSK